MYVYVAASHLDWIVRSFGEKQFQDFLLGPGLILGDFHSPSWQRIRTQHSTNEVLTLGLPVEIHKLDIIEGPHKPRKHTERPIQDTLGPEGEQSLTLFPSVVLPFWGPISGQIVNFLSLRSFSLIYSKIHSCWLILMTVWDTFWP